MHVCVLLHLLYNEYHIHSPGKVRTFLGCEDILAGPHKEFWRSFGFRIVVWVTVRVRRVIGMVRVGVKKWSMHCVY